MNRKPIIRKIVALGAASSVTLGMSLLGVGAIAAHASTETVTFTVAGGSIALSQSTGTQGLTAGSPIAMPDTTVTDGRNAYGVPYGWSITNVASNLVDQTALRSATIIPAADIAMAQTIAGTGYGMTSGGSDAPTNTPGAPSGSIAVANDTVGSVFTYSPTAQLNLPVTAVADTYAGTVTQTLTPG